MAYAALEILLDHLIELANDHTHPIHDDNNKGTIEGLGRDLRFLKEFLRDSERKDERTPKLIGSIRDAVYQVEDDIDVFVAHTISTRSRGLFSIFKSSKSSSPSFSLEDIRKKVGDVKKQIETSRKDSASLTVEDDGSKHEKSKPPAVGLRNVIGFQDLVNAAIGYLNEQTKELDVITIIGMPGSGKTTLARKIYGDERIKCGFPFRIWVDVSSEFKAKDIFLTILTNFITITEDVDGKNDDELAFIVTSYLKGQRALIVLDDMWATCDWDRIQKAFPTFNNMCKVLITSCNEEMGRYTNQFRQLIKVRPMSESESWELLQLEVFGNTKCPPELETVGKLIAKQCDGLPLAVVTMAGILVREDLSYGDDIRAKRTAWLEMCQSIPEYRNKKFYDILPTHLKVCFLYLAAFPYDREIQVAELILMWIAEGFIAPDSGRSVEECAEAYLEDLIRRNLVKIGRMKADYKVKTIRIHRMLHDFCKKEAGKGREDLLTEIKFKDGDFVARISELSKPRWLSIHSNVSEFISRKPLCPSTRSLFVFSKDEVCLSVEHISPEAFKLLRVLYGKLITYNQSETSDKFHFLNLRYLALSSKLSFLPAHFSKHYNLQTLQFNTTSPTLDVKPDILEFTELKHFKTNASARLCKIGKDGSGGKKLQTLTFISPDSCTKELFRRACNLKKLGIRGKLSVLLDKKTGTFDNLASLGNLESLKLLNDEHPNPPSKGRLDGLLAHDKFPPTLKSLTLAGTYLDWSQMSELEKLKNLEVLELKDKAFMGQIWKASEGVFCSLKSLDIAETDLAIWVASARHFPHLRRLKLRNCDQLQEVPIELAGIQSLQLLDLYETKLAAESAKRFQEEKQRLLKGQNTDAAQFNLSIYPIS